MFLYSKHEFVMVNIIKEPMAWSLPPFERSYSNAGIFRAYVYPNPTRDPNSAVLHYELSQGGPVRKTLVDITGAVLGKHSLAYDAVFPGDGVGVGQADIPLRDMFPVGDLAPGLYMIQIKTAEKSAFPLRRYVLDVK